MATVRYTDRQIRKMLKTGKLKDMTDWDRLHKMKDSDIDYSDIPEMTDSELKKMTRPGRPTVDNPKVVLSFRADKDVADGLRKIKNWSSVANDTLRKHLSRLGVL